MYTYCMYTYYMYTYNMYTYYMYTCGLAHVVVSIKKTPSSQQRQPPT